MSGEAPVATGDFIERYVLDHPLRAGGMGVVWVAHSKALNIPVALKILRAGENNADAVDRMANEAHAAASLGHPAIVRVLDFGESGGAPFIAMELLEGEDLSATLERESKLSSTRAVGLLLPIIDGLATAHARGIIHRDIKPENIFMARDAMGRMQPKLLDFGIAKLTDRSTKTRLTQSGTLLGTLPYLSPEQAHGRDDVDHRTDIWSLGVVLYELITGSQPFRGNTHNAFVRSITEDQITRPAGAADEQLWRIIDGCLKKDAADRWESMWALGEALALWLVERGIEVDAASRSLREAWLRSGVSGVLMMTDVSEAPRAALSPPPPPSARSKNAGGDPISRAVVLTVKLPRAGVVGALSRAKHGVGVGFLIALAVGMWATRQPLATTYARAGRARAAAAPRIEARAIVPTEVPPPKPEIVTPEPSDERQPVVRAPSHVAAEAPAPSHARPREAAKRALAPKLPSTDPEFGF